MAEEKPNPIATTRPTNFMTTTRPTSSRLSQGVNGPRIPRDIDLGNEESDCKIFFFQ